MSALTRARISAALWGGFLFLVTSWPNPPDPRPAGFPLDKVTHFVLYGVEAFLLYRAVGWKERAPVWSRVLLIIGVMAVWGIVDEIHQDWIPGRRMDAGDLVADVVGAAAGATFSPRRPSRRPRSSSGAG